MKAYEFSRTTPHLYLGEIDAIPDPFEPDVWRAPAFSVFGAPPNPQPGYAVIRVGLDDGEWEQIEDHRGEIGYLNDGTPVQITHVGPIDDPVVTLLPPPGPHHQWVGGAWQVDLEEMRAAKVLEINAARDAAIVSGFEFNGVLYDSDPKSIQRISGAVTLGMLNPAFETDWITFDNSVVRLNAAQLAGLGAAAGQHEATQIFKARQLKDQALAATTREQLAAITW